MNSKKIENVGDICNAVLPKDDSALQWSEVHHGKCKDLHREIERLFERFVTYADEQRVSRRTEDDLWRTFSKELENRNLKGLLNEKTFATSDDEVTFENQDLTGVLFNTKTLLVKFM